MGGFVVEAGCRLMVSSLWGDIPPPYPWPLGVGEIRMATWRITGENIHKLICEQFRMGGGPSPTVSNVLAGRGASYCY